MNMYKISFSEWTRWRKLFQFVDFTLFLEIKVTWYHFLNAEEKEAPIVVWMFSIKSHNTYSNIHSLIETTKKKIVKHFCN